MQQPPTLVIFSGAGLSAPSGIATFRDRSGLWYNHKIDQICDFNTWQHNYDLVHEFYNQRRLELKTARPNAAHQTIAAWQSTWGDRVRIITQNVDNLLEAAGCVDVCHLHGDLTRMQCIACEHEWHAGYKAWHSHRDVCANCGSGAYVKPAVVFFHEHAPRYRNLYWHMHALHNNSISVVIGTTGIVVDIQSLIANRPGTKILNNLQPSEAIDERYFDHVFYEDVIDAIPKIDQLVSAHMNQHSG